MASSPILVVGGATANDAGETVVGSATDNTQTDTYQAYGYNNVIVENGGNLSLSPASAPIGLHLGLSVNPYTTVELGSAVGVADSIQLAGYNGQILQTPGTALSGTSTVDVTVIEDFSGSDVVHVVNPGGANQVNLYSAPHETVTLTGASNGVTAGSFSTITLNGAASNQVLAGAANLTVGGKGDHLFGFVTGAYLGGASNTVSVGDENVLLSILYSPGFNVVTVGDGENSLILSGTNNLITVGGGDNMITAGDGGDIVSILGRGSKNSTHPARRDDAVSSPVPVHPSDTVVLAGAGNTVRATYENVTVSGAANTGTAMVTLGRGSNAVTLAGDQNTINVGDGTDTIGLSGNLNSITVHDTRGHGTVTIALNTGTGDTIGLGSAGGSIVGTGLGTTTISQTLSSRAAVTVDLAAGVGAITLGNGTDRVTANGGGTRIIVGDGDDVISAEGGSPTSSDQIQVGRGRDMIAVGSYASVVLGAGADTLTGGSSVTVTAGSGHHQVTLADHASVSLQTSNAIVSVGDWSSVLLGDGSNAVTAGANADIQVGQGNNTVVTGANTVVYAGAGHDSISLGDNAQAVVSGSSTSHASLTLANDDTVRAIGGVLNIKGGTNVTLDFDGSKAGTTVTFTDKDDLAFLGSNGSAHVLLNPGGGDLVSVQALDATGAYAGTVEVTNFATGDVLYLRGLDGGVIAGPLSSFSAVMANIVHSGQQEILKLEGGGRIVFTGALTLQASEFVYTQQYGTVV